MMSPTSPTASSHESRRHFPPESFIGYLSRRSPCPCSRTAAPLAQWAPRLNGESKSGSCPVHTPSWTSAITPHPTEQWVQMLRRISVGAASFSPRTSAARAWRVIIGAAEYAAPPSAAIPERRRNSRRETASARIPPKIAATADVSCAGAPGWLEILASFMVEFSGKCAMGWRGRAGGQIWRASR